MTDRLWPRLPLEPDEGSTSFVSRLAKLYAKTARAFCHDLGIGFQAVVDGSRDALQRIADLARVSVDALMDNALVRTAHRTYVWRGEPISAANLSRFTLQVCPACLADDVARAEAGLGHGPYGRATWLVRYVRTCPHHQVALLSVGGTQETAHDLALSVAPLLERIEAGEVHVEHRPASRLETYVLDRLAGRTTGRTPWLDAIGVSAVADACEVFGSVAAFGRTMSMRNMGPRERYTAGDVGFEIACDGPDGIREVLAALDAPTWESKTHDRPLSRYGSVRGFIMRGREKRPDLDPFREVVSDHIRWTRPIGAGEIVLGRPVAERYMHSLETAGQEYGLDVRLIRTVLKQAGVLGQDSDGRAAEYVLFDARANHPLLAGVARSIPAERIRYHLHCSAQQARAVVRAGFIPTLVRKPTGMGDWSRRYAIEDIDRFLQALTEGSEPVATQPQGACRIPIGGVLARIGAMEVVRLILDRKLPWVGRLTTVQGFDAVLVRLEDLRALEPGYASAWSSSTLVPELGLPHRTVKTLLEAGIIPSELIQAYPNGWARRSVSDDAVRNFRASYAWCAALVHEWKVSPQTCAARLRRAGIRPVLAKEDYGIDFYLRADLP